MSFDRNSFMALRPSTKPKLRVSLLNWQQPAALPDVDEVAIDHVAGDVRVLQQFPSAILEHARDVWIYLPPGYERDQDTRYAVLYMHDGNNLFDSESAFGGQDWGVNESAEWMIQAGLLPPTIIVGVANSPARLDEYTWTPDGEEGGGKGADYARFLVEELKPYIDANYRTRAGREHTGVLGSSLGGLISLYLGHHHGDTFGRVGAMSPSLWWADRQVLRDLNGLRSDLRLWLDMGQAEGEDEEEAASYLQDARALRELLEAAGFVVGQNLAHWEVPGADHSESAWGQRVTMAMMFLFAAPHLAAEAA